MKTRIRFAFLLYCIAALWAATAPATAQAQPSPPDPYPGIGTGPAASCLFDFNNHLRKCEGFPSQAFGSGADQTLLGGFAGTRVWNARDFSADRATVSGPPKPMVLSGHIRSDRLALNTLTKWGLLIARITANPDSLEERRYGIGGPLTAGRNLRNQFFVVIAPYAEKVDPVGDAESREISTWRLYGRAKNGGALVDIGKTGKLRWCKNSHADSVRKRGVQFISCANAHRMAQFERKLQSHPAFRNSPVYSALRTALDTEFLLPALQSLASRDKQAKPTAAWLGTTGILGALLNPSERDEIVQIMDESAVAPAWITCGIGCCSIE